MDPTNIVTSSKQYVTIVNLTPYRLRYLKDQSHSYQIDMDFGDVPPGESRQNIANYYAGKIVNGKKTNPVDDNGEAYYQVVGTSRTFMIKATTHIPDEFPRRTIIDLSGWNMGRREYSDPHPEVPITIIITGSEQYGYSSSIYQDQSKDGWMRSIYDTIRDRKIKHIAMPGSHDAGMSRIGYEWLGSSRNTQTQGITIHDQLRIGSRYFDMRIARYNGEFITAHVNDELGSLVVGASGESLNDVIDHINQ
jgi:hypothetical protein